jgi:hypothetical protein
MINHFVSRNLTDIQKSYSSYTHPVPVPLDETRRRHLNVMFVSERWHLCGNGEKLSKKFASLESASKISVIY